MLLVRNSCYLRRDHKTDHVYFLLIIEGGRKNKLDLNHFDGKIPPVSRMTKKKIKSQKKFSARTLSFAAKNAKKYV